MKKKRLTPKQLTDLLRKKSCNTPYTIYLAKELFDDVNHPIAKIDDIDFTLREIFEHIILEDDTNTTTAS
jgi:hypothetical protein